MRNHQPALVQHQMADQRVDPVGGGAAEVVRFGFELLQRFRQTMADLDLAAAQLLHQLDVVIAGHAQGSAVGHHRHHQTQHAR